ncbi:MULTISPECIES: hypothetical protein [unclassified Sulfitobacter]|uniref:hypothetical protein n=1 Tax=unclassified Sulfitobacter TaxID=196795 RepID=UPI000A93C5EE|nr:MULTISPECIES: hypothetical protein [unclassified Sulfitobacter]MBO9440278.1 hypothetical protein [Sulfitobacter sp. R18_2]
MNIKRRLEAMEQKSGGLDYLIVYFRTVFEAKGGGIEGEIWKASVVTGPHAGAFVERDSAEALEDFQARCQAISRGEIDPNEKPLTTQEKDVMALEGNENRVESAMEKGRENE